jgi:hypothetical protein
MWLEKLCKAYEMQPGADAQKWQSTHNVISHTLPKVIAQNWIKLDLGFGKPQHMMSIRKLCREIDLLHPQINDDGRRPDNVEYPWADKSGAIEAPARWQFPLASSLYTTAGGLLIRAAVALTRKPTQ